MAKIFRGKAQQRAQILGSPTNSVWLSGPTDWYQSIGQELLVIWGSVAKFEFELPEIRWQRAQSIWLEGTLDDLRERKRAVLSMARSAISLRDMPNAELEALWPMVPVNTISPRIANLICQAYQEPPVRSFAETTEGTPDTTGVDAGFDEFYTELNVNEAMDNAYRAALFTNTVLIYWDGTKFLALTPEYFRIADDGIWVARRGDDGILVFDVWTPETHEVRDTDGKLLVRQSEPNPYGMVPGVLLKLNRSNDPYGAGIVEAAEINAWSNLIDLYATRIAVFQGFPVGVLRNYEEGGLGGGKAKNSLNIGPGKLLSMQNRGNDSSTQPSFEYVTPEQTYATMQQFRRNAVADFQRNQDLPAFLVDEAAGTPPSGVALQVLERQLNARRRSHLTALRRAETALAKLIQCIAGMRGRTKLVVTAFDIKYAEPREFVDPMSSLQYDLALAMNGLFSASALTQKYLGVQSGQTDEEAIAQMQTNKALVSPVLVPVDPKPTTA